MSFQVEHWALVLPKKKKIKNEKYLIKLLFSFFPNFDCLRHLFWRSTFYLRTFPFTIKIDFFGGIKVLKILSFWLPGIFDKFI